MFQVLTRDAKIKRYKEMKELKEKLSTLSKAMSSPNVDEETKRSYFTTLLLNYVNQALDELSSIEQEKPILDYMEKHAGGKFIYLIFLIVVVIFIYCTKQLSHCWVKVGGV